MNNPLIPMLSLTGNPSVDKISDMFDHYLSVGIDSVMLYPRTGLEIEYMSEKWLTLIKNILSEAKEKAITIWLYDEFNWPSGSCKNHVIQEDPSFAAKRICMKEGKATVETVARGQAQMVAQPFDNDMLNPDSVDCFIRLTHEVYARHFSEYFGNVIVGVFTDEPSFIYTANGEGMYPYYDGVEKSYFEETGNDLFSDIEKYESGETTHYFPWIFRQLISERFKSAYMDRIADWCQKHGLILTGHTLDDENPLRATRVTGNWFRFFENVPQPGVDEIPTKFGVHNDMLFSMIDHQKRQGKQHAMAELFALGPCSMSYQRRRQMIYYAAAYGVDRYFIAISHLDGRGNILKPDYFDNFNHYNPDFKGISLLANEAQIAAQVAEKRADASVGIRVPYTAYLKALSTHTEQTVYDKLADLMTSLIYNQIGFCFLAEDEPSDLPCIIKVSENGYTEESHQFFWSDFAFARSVLLPFQNQFIVTEKDGSLPKDVLVKCYDDGSVLVVSRLNHKVEPRTLFLLRSGKIIPFIFEGFGVNYFAGNSESLPEQYDREISLAMDDLSFLHATPNLYRCVLLKSNTSVVHLKEDMTLRVHTRIYEGSDQVTVDGRSYSATDISTELTDCFNPLYRSFEIFLPAGTHTISCEHIDYPYLPAVILSGHFDQQNDVLSHRTGKGAFFGTVTFQYELDIPISGKTAIRLPDTNLLTEINFEDGSSVLNIREPYLFTVPQNLVGKHTVLHVSFSSTIGSLFGDLLTMRQNGIFTPGWDDVPSSELSIL